MQRNFVTSHVVLRCYCYYHRAQAIYYGAVCGHKETKRSMNFLHPAEDKSCYELNGKKKQTQTAFWKEFWKGINNKQTCMHYA